MFLTGFNAFTAARPSFNALSYGNMQALGTIALTSTMLLGCTSSAAHTHTSNQVVVPVPTVASPNPSDRTKPKEDPKDTIHLWEQANVRDYFQGDDEYTAIDRNFRKRSQMCGIINRYTINHGLKGGEFRAYDCIFEDGKSRGEKANAIFPDSDRIILYHGVGGRTGIDYKYFGLRHSDGKYYPYRKQLVVTYSNEVVRSVDVWDVTDDGVPDIVLYLLTYLHGGNSLINSYRVFVGKMSDMKF